jgi:hypothetical protein
VSDLRSTGSFDTSRCHTLSAGNTEHDVPATGIADAGGAAATARSTVHQTVVTTPIPRILRVIGRCAGYG